MTECFRCEPERDCKGCKKPGNPILLPDGERARLIQILLDRDMPVPPNADDEFVRKVVEQREKLVYKNGYLLLELGELRRIAYKKN